MSGNNDLWEKHLDIDILKKILKTYYKSTEIPCFAINEEGINFYQEGGVCDYCKKI